MVSTIAIIWIIFCLLGFPLFVFIVYRRFFNSPPDLPPGQLINIFNDQIEEEEIILIEHIRQIPAGSFLYISVPKSYLEMYGRLKVVKELSSAAEREVDIQIIYERAGQEFPAISQLGREGKIKILCAKKRFKEYFRVAGNNHVYREMINAFGQSMPRLAIDFLNFPAEAEHYLKKFKRLLRSSKKARNGLVLSHGF